MSLEGEDIERAVIVVGDRLHFAAEAYHMSAPGVGRPRGYGGGELCFRRIRGISAVAAPLALWR